MTNWRSGFRVAGLTVAAWLIQTVPVPATQIGVGAPRDPVALGLANQALVRLSGGTSLTDVTLQVTVSFYGGGTQETGTGTFYAIGDSQSKLVLNLSNGTQTEVRNGQAGAWVFQNGSVFLEAAHNCWVDATWFFPGLIFTNVSGNTQSALINLGSQTWSGSPVSQIQTYQAPPGHNATVSGVIQSLSAETVSLDPVSGLPLAIDFNLHSDSDATTNVPAEIQFSNYQSVSGMSVPFHVQKYVGGQLLLDVTLTSVTVNSGLSPTLFAIP
jgi:hypothetical protein